MPCVINWYFASPALYQNECHSNHVSNTLSLVVGIPLGEMEDYNDRRLTGISPASGLEFCNQVLGIVVQRHLSGGFPTLWSCCFILIANAHHHTSLFFYVK
jgi:hypothetical protein